VGEISVRPEWKLAYSPEVAQAEIMPSHRGPDVCTWHEAAVFGPFGKVRLLRCPDSLALAAIGRK
jgi:hypothetical protein